MSHPTTPSDPHAPPGTRASAVGQPGSFSRGQYEDTVTHTHVLWHPEGEVARVPVVQDNGRLYARTGNGKWYALSDLNGYGWRVGAVQVKSPERIARYDAQLPLPPHEAARTREANNRILDRMISDAMALPAVEIEEIKQADAARRDEWPDYVCQNCGDEKGGGKWRSHTYRDEGVTEYRCISPRCGVCHHRVEAIDLDNGVCLDCRVKAAKVQP